MKVLKVILMSALGFGGGWFAMSGFNTPWETVNTSQDPVEASILGQRSPGMKHGLPPWYEDQANKAILEYKRLRAQATNGTPGSVDGLAEALHVRHMRKRATRLQECLRQWSAVDPEDALAHCRNLVKQSHRHEAIHAWARQMAMSDPDKAVELLKSEIPPGHAEAEAALRGMTEALARQEPDVALALMKTYQRFPRESLAAVAQVDPERDLEFVLEDVSQNYFSGAAQNVMEQWGAQDSDRVLAFYDSLSEADRERLRLPMIKGIAKSDTEKGAELTLQMAPENRSLLVEIVADWRDMKKASDWVASLDSDTTREQIYDRILPYVAKQNPENALPLLLEFDSLRNESDYVFRKWAEDDFDAAYQALNELEDPRLQAKAVEGMLGEISKKHPEAVRSHLDFLIEIGGGELRLNMSSILYELNENERVELVAAYPELLDESVRSMLENYGWSDPERAIALADRLPDSPGKVQGIQKAVSSWAQRDPDAAAEWVAQMPRGEGRDYATMNLVDAWSRYDTAAVTNWIASLSDPQQQRVAVEDFVRATVVRDGAAAWKVAAVLDDPEEQRAAQSLVLTDWAERDPEAAAAPLSELPSIPSELQAAHDKAITTREAWEGFFQVPGGRADQDEESTRPES